MRLHLDDISILDIAEITMNTFALLQGNIYRHHQLQFEITQT